MTRLTKKISGFIPNNAQKYRNSENITHNEITNKLGQLEDIEDVIGMSLIDYFKGISFDIERNNQYLKLEEELGIDFRTLFKAIKQEVLFVKTETDIRRTLKVGEGWGAKHFDFDENGEPYIFAQIMYPNDITHKEWVTPLYLKTKDYGKTRALTKEELL